MTRATHEKVGLLRAIVASFYSADLYRDVEDFLVSLQLWVPPIGYVACLLGSLLFRVVQAFLYGSIARLYARKRNVALDFQPALRLAAVAVTPLIVLRTLLWLLPSEPSWYIRWPIAILITAAYLRSAVEALMADSAAAPPAAQLA